MSANSDVAIIIPTFNRAEFVVRQLSYYASVGCPQAIYVGDSSQGDEWDRTARAVAQLRNRINVVHTSLPDHNDTEAIMALLRLGSEPYAVFSGDDDFLVPASLEVCAQFLSAHPEVSLVHGVNSSIRLDGPGPYGRVATAGGHYGARPAEQGTATARLTAYMPNPFSTNFSLQRRGEFLETMVATSAMEDRVFREYLPNCLRIVNGQAKRLDCFYLVRQSLGGQDRTKTDVYAWLTNPNWQGSYQIFQEVLAGALARQDGVTVEEAQEVVKEGFWGYLVDRLGKGRRSRHVRPPTGAASRMRKLAKGIPIARRVWLRLKNRGAAEVTETQLERLLSRSSPFHTDFMPIYQAFAAPSPLQQGGGTETATRQNAGGVT